MVYNLCVYFQEASENVEKQIEEEEASNSGIEAVLATIEAGDSELAGDPQAIKEPGKSCVALMKKYLLTD